MNPLSDRIETLALERLRVASRSAISGNVVRSVEQATLSTLVDPMVDQLVFDLNTYVTGDKVESETVSRTVEITWAEWASWWQHTKAVHFPTLSKWLRRPPRKTWNSETRTAAWVTERWVTFPDADVYPAQLGRPVYVQRITPA